MPRRVLGGRARPVPRASHESTYSASKGYAGYIWYGEDGNSRYMCCSMYTVGCSGCAGRRIYPCHGRAAPLIPPPGAHSSIYVLLYNDNLTVISIYIITERDPETGVYPTPFFFEAMAAVSADRAAVSTAVDVIFDACAGEGVLIYATNPLLGESPRPALPSFPAYRAHAQRALDQHAWVGWGE